MSTILDENKIEGIAVDRVNKKVILTIFNNFDWIDVDNSKIFYTIV